MIDNLLQGLPAVAGYIDDILLTGENEEKHLHTLQEVLRRLDEAGLRLKFSKCKFMQQSVSYLGYRIDKSGLHPL